MKSMRATVVGILLSIVLVCAAVVTAKQQTAARSGSQAAQASSDSVQTGINVAKTIVTAEVVQRSRTGHFSAWDELYHSPDLQKFWQNPQISDGPEVVPGWTLSLVVSANGDHFQIAVQNITSACGLSVYSSDNGRVYEAGYVDCVQLVPQAHE